MTVLSSGTVLATGVGGTAEGPAGPQATGWGTFAPIIPHPFETITGLIVFSVLVFLAAKYAVPRFEAMYAERRSAIEGRIEEAQQAKAEADAALAEYQQQLKEARTEAGRLREEAREEGAQILAEMRERAQAESARITESAQRQVESERAQAVTQLRQQVGGLASTLASKIVGESLEDDARQSRVIDRFLDELESGQVTASTAGSAEVPAGEGR